MMLVAVGLEVGPDGLDDQMLFISLLLQVSFFDPPSTTISSHLMQWIQPGTTVITE